MEHVSACNRMRHILVSFPSEIIYWRVIHESLTTRFVSRNGYLLARFHLLDVPLRIIHGGVSRMCLPGWLRRSSRETMESGQPKDQAIDMK
jgi:hypothetical protein